MNRIPSVVCIEQAAAVVGLPVDVVRALHRGGYFPPLAVKGVGIRLAWSTRALERWAQSVRLAAQGGRR
jgi:hypothetical protein